ncbi:MAG TPA: sensor domain-containing diguanylate cyclase [Dissulfurispiraceae bacterium]|nr:sensor domain-containing diguanylate cyclase [Dissulfurispiraceae bacterium]
MSNKTFLRLLNDAFGETQAKPIPVDGLSGETLTIAKKINSEIVKTEKCQLIAGGSIRIIEKVEDFYEKIIGIISAMIRVSELCGTECDLNALCKEIVRIFSRELAFDNCSIMLKDEKGKHLVLVAGSGKGDKYRKAKTVHTDTEMEIREGIAGKAYSSGRPVFVPDVKKDPAFKTFDTCVSIVSLLSVPIKAGDGVIGVMNFSHPLHQGLYDRNMENLMVLLSAFVGQVIMLSKLYGSMSRWNESLKEEVAKKTAELKRKNRQLQKIALIDPLTGIFNRRFFFKRLEEEFLRTTRYGVQFSLLFIDIDNLKPINDTYGHLAGDKVIKTVASILRQIGRKGDVACRLGGDEFGYALLASDIEGAYNFAVRLQEKFVRHNFRGMDYTPTVSVGIANTQGCKFKDHRDFYNAADVALYEAKLLKNTIRIYSRKKHRNRLQLPLLD